LKLTNKTDLTSNHLRSVLSYDQDSGSFFWRDCIRPDWNGKLAGTLHGGGSIVIRIQHWQYLAHRLAWLYVYGEWPAVIDHINRIKHDNRIANLRSCTQQQNVCNKTKYSNNSSGFTGVSKEGGKWKSYHQKDGKRVHIGNFNTPDEAYAARVNAINAAGVNLEFYNVRVEEMTE
jgi:hypothetical protein